MSQKTSGYSQSGNSILERLLPAPKNSGFRMDGYFVWGGSVIKVGDTFHMFASRWPKKTKFPQGYREHSEIVHATADNIMGPYKFLEVVLKGRGGTFWDGKMCHNPKIIKAGDYFVLYYIGSAHGSALRKCGYAWSKSINGPWKRRDEPLPFGEDHNNPAPYVYENGRIRVVFRDRELRMYSAEADSFNGTYRVVARDIFPGIRIEDPDLFTYDETLHMVVEDNVGALTGHERFGAHLISEDGIQWTRHDPIQVYTHTLQWEDGTTTKADRRERPELFNTDAVRKGNGHPTHLLTAVKAGNTTWCHIQAIAPPDDR